MSSLSDSTRVATVSQYVVAMKAVRDQFARTRPFSDSKELKMLRAHYGEPDHTITTTRLAELVGFAKFSGANLQYGRLAARIADKLGYRPEPANDPHWWRTLAYGNDVLTVDGRYEWIMRPEVCAALEQMGWAGRART